MLTTSRQKIFTMFLLSVFGIGVGFVCVHCLNCLLVQRVMLHLISVQTVLDVGSLLDEMLLVFVCLMHELSYNPGFM